jgi:T-lymphoma invasion and metastasis-inducing protein 1
VYWKDTVTNDTWGLNFTSPIDAKQFRECCVSFENKINENPKIPGSLRTSPGDLL